MHHKNYILVEEEKNNPEVKPVTAEGTMVDSKNIRTKQEWGSSPDIK